jgi:2-polyprenyl-6-hydroxyphenyl methylase/3-demethylubiquinone-9 3-methyltransferase
LRLIIVIAFPTLFQAAAMRPITESSACCKCCSQSADLFGVVDFHQHCDEARSERLPVSGIPIYYYRCSQCGFLFTTAFDGFSHADFAEQIYNEGYSFVDPDFAEVRPSGNAQMVAGAFGKHRELSILDYGGGNGRTAEGLRQAGFTNVTTYDPFVPRFATRPSTPADEIICFEVVEHTPDPLAIFRDMASLLADHGSILLSTLMQPDDIEKQRLNWWYVGPRNGHISLHSYRSLTIAAQRCGFQVRSFNANVHLLFRANSYFR